MNIFISSNVVCGLSEKLDGPMKYDFDNQLAFFKRQALDGRKLIGADLTHGDCVMIVDSQTAERMMSNCDALITKDKNCLLTVTVADCLPIYFYDVKKQVVALAHAGWKGVLNNIAQKTALSLINDFGCNPNDIKIFIGPHIQECHFEVKNDVASQFNPQYLIKKAGKIYVRLAAAINDQLLKTGLLAQNISISPECTFCLKEKYFSFRRERDKMIKAMIAYIGLK